jgi:uncharacterized protein (TIGR02599 family)
MTPVLPIRPRRGFTLVEVLVSLAVLSIIVVLLVAMTDQTTKIWRSSSGRMEAFRNARGAFESLTQTLSQATLNTYYDYFDAAGNRIDPEVAAPARYDRYSELHFISGPARTLLGGVTQQDGTPYTEAASGHAVFFQAPLGFTLDRDAKRLDNVLNAIGYFVEFGSDRDLLPDFVAEEIEPRYRYRLVQFIQPSEEMRIYAEDWPARSTHGGANWFRQPLGAPVRPARILAENIIAMVIMPKRSQREAEANPGLPPLAPDYAYDSRPRPPSAGVTRHQLPPLVEVVMVAIDEASALRLQAEYGDRPPLEALLGGRELFTQIADPNRPAAFQADLAEMEEALRARNLNYRIFSSEVIIRASKWSED